MGKSLVWNSFIVVFMSAVLTVSMLMLIVARSSVSAGEYSEVPVSATSEAKVTNVVVSAVDNEIRVQFDYELANGATSATVDAALQTGFSFQPLTITGSGKYDALISDLPDGNYSIFIVISGNPDFLIGNVEPSSQPMVITLPASAPDISNGDQYVRDMRKIYHQQKHYF